MIYDFCILGAGIAGLSLADALQENNYSVCVLEKNEVASGASGTPGALVNPATGRKGTKTWKAEVCYRAIRKNLEKIQAFTSRPFFLNNGLLRPALTTKMGQKMRKQLEETSWPDDWCYWLNEKEIKKKHPGINCVDGGLWLPIGLSVDAGAYLQAYAAYLEAQNVKIETGVVAKINRIVDGWNIEWDGHKVRCENLVFATGYDTLQHPFWRDLPFTPVKGQVARFSANERLLDFEHSISSLGYICRIGRKNEFIQGSTYNHHFKDLKPDEDGEHYLRERMKKTLPELADQAVLLSQWAGVRVSTPNRKPILGRHPEHKNLYLFTGLGSKGLMYGKFLAEHYAEHLHDKTPLFEGISIDRVL